MSVKPKPYNTMTALQAAILVVSIILADISMERVVSEETKTPDGWLSVMLGGGYSLLAGCICAALSRRYPGKTYFRYNREIVGKWVGYVLSLAFIGYNLLLASYAVRIQAEFTRYFLLDRTPIEVLVVVCLGVGTYLVIGGIKPVTKLAEFFTPLTLISFVTIWMLGIKVMHPDRLLPVLGEGLAPVLKGAVPTMLGFIGYESILVFTASMKEPQKAVKAVSIGVIVCILFYVANYLTTIGYLGVEEVTTLTWPSMEVVRGISFPGGFFENFELLMIGVWIILIFMSYASAHYIAGLGLSQMFHVKPKWFQFLVPIAIYFLAMYPKDVNGAFQLGSMTGYTALLTGGIIPLALLLISFIKGRRHAR